MNTRPLVSVITPVYNGEPYIAECIESVLAQTYEDWDYTLVDNASTDGTSETIARYASRHPRVRHLRFDEFVDATANHNRAFEAISADSQFCKVVQADDWIYPECLSRMVSAAGVSDSVGVVGAYQLRESRVDLAGLPHHTTYAPGREILRGSLLGLFNVTGPPTATLLRSEFVRERRPFWQEGLRHEDEESMFWMLSRHDFAFVHQVLTVSRERAGSRWEWSDNMNSHGPESIVFLLRYGRLALDELEYRARLRQRLRNYVRWHIRQFPRVSRLRNPEFFELHNAKRKQILDEANDDSTVIAAMNVVGALLLREAIVRGGARETPPVRQPSN